jgi:hypothetical protein
MTIQSIRREVEPGTTKYRVDIEKDQKSNSKSSPVDARQPRSSNDVLQ